MNTRAPVRRYDSVQQDWRAILPYAKGSLFADHTEKLENTYRMFSVSLNLVSHVLLSERSQFLNKLNTLEEIVDELGDAFIEATEQLGYRIRSHSSRLWKFLDLYHFDLNTCLRETCVLLKSFLLVLPDDQLDRFDFTVCGLARARRKNTATHPALIRARRMAAVAGE